MAIGTNLFGQSAGTGVQGQRVGPDIGSGRRIPNWDGREVNVSVMCAPLVALLKNLGAKKFPVSNAMGAFFHLETDQNPRHVETNGTQSAAETSLEVTAGHGVRVVAGTQLLCERTGEIMEVSARSTDTLTIVRGAQGTTAAALNDDEELLMIGTAFADGTAAPAGVSFEPTVKTNYCQIYKASFDLSGRALESENYGEDEKSRIMTRTAEAIQVQKELSFIFNANPVAPVANTTAPKTGGLMAYISTNRTNQGGALVESDWRNWIKGWYRRNYGETDLVCLAGENVINAVDGFGLDAVRYTPDDKVAGMAVKRYQTSFGNVKLVPHGMLSPGGSGVSVTATTNTITAGVVASVLSGGHSGFAIGINPKHLGERTFKNRGLRTDADIQTPGVDGRKWGMMEDAGIGVANEAAHALMVGVTG